MAEANYNMTVNAPSPLSEKGVILQGRLCKAALMCLLYLLPVWTHADEHAEESEKTLLQSVRFASKRKCIFLLALYAKAEITMLQAH